MASLLEQVRQGESGSAAGNYTAQNPISTASGAYGFINSTWNQLAGQAGYSQYVVPNAGTTPGEGVAKLAPPSVQDAVATYAASNYDPNSSFLWAKSAPPGGYTGSVTAGDTAGDTGITITAPGVDAGGGGTDSGGGQSYLIPPVPSLGFPGVTGGGTGTDALGNPFSTGGWSGIFNEFASFFERWGIFLLGAIMVAIGFWAVAKGKTVTEVVHDSSRRAGRAAAVVARAA